MPSRPFLTVIPRKLLPSSRVSNNCHSDRSITPVISTGAIAEWRDLMFQVGSDPQQKDPSTTLGMTSFRLGIGNCSSLGMTSFRLGIGNFSSVEMTIFFFSILCHSDRSITPVISTGAIAEWRDLMCQVGSDPQQKDLSALLEMTVLMSSE